jgi:VWFA-related protein
MPTVLSLRASVHLTVFICVILILAPCTTRSQVPDPPPSSPDQLPAAPPDPLIKPASPKTLKISVNLVTVPVVVRDSSGRAVGTLRKEDFRLFDNRQPQEISQFAVEEPNQSAVSLPDPSASNASGNHPKFVVPNRFTALLFDDVHSTFENLPQLRTAALRLLSNSPSPAERIAIFATSGKLAVDFTDDRGKLQDAIQHLQPNPFPGTKASDCPNISHYEANLIINRHDLNARRDAEEEARSLCGVKDPKMAAGMVLEIAERVLHLGDEQASIVIRSLSEIVDHLASLPGRRAIILASPSFLLGDTEHREQTVIDRALRSHVTISTLDTRGLYTDQNELADSNVLEIFADGTGGTFFRNSNDINEGLRRVAAAPEYVYELGFSPKDLKQDGKYHHLKVALTASNRFTVTARDGYFAPAHAVDPAQAENDEIKTALFSQNEIHDLPVTMQTNFVQDAKRIGTLNVLTFANLSQLPYRQSGGENANDLRMIAAIFDRNAKYMGAIDRKVAVHWPDAKATSRAVTTFTFRLDPGSYMVRLVVRDAESQHLFAQNVLVVLP